MQAANLSIKFPAPQVDKRGTPSLRLDIPRVLIIADPIQNAKDKKAEDLMTISVPKVEFGTCFEEKEEESSKVNPLVKIEDIKLEVVRSSDETSRITINMNELCVLFDKDK